MESKLVIISMENIQVEEVQWLWKPYIPYGKLTIIEGDPGEGKTSFALWVVSLLTQGKGFDENGNIIQIDPDGRRWIGRYCKASIIGCRCRLLKGEGNR